MACIFCQATKKLNTIEHIVPESLGNKKYTLSKGEICDACNNRFSHFEDKAITNTILGHERAVLGVISKKGNPGIGKSGHVKFTAKKPQKNVVLVNGLKPSDIKDYDRKTKTFHLTLPTFNKKSIVPTSKLLLKMGYEALYKSKQKVLKKYDFGELMAFLATESNIDWPFITPDKKFSADFDSIPTHYDKYHLKKCSCKLLFKEVDSKCLIFRFEYRGVAMEINLLNRNTDWMQSHVDNKRVTRIYPLRFGNKFGLPTTFD